MTTNEFTDSIETSVTSDTDTIEYEWNGSAPPSTAIAEAIADETDRDPRHIPPLHEYVDADCLDSLVTRDSKNPNEDVTISFAYEDYVVVVSNDGSIELQSNTAGNGRR